MGAPPMTDEGVPDLYAALGLVRGASDTDIRRAYRNLVSKIHPDKGGDADTFRAVQQAYEVLSDATKRHEYDTTGTVVRSVEDEFMDSFAGGSFRDRVRRGEMEKVNLSDQISVRQEKKAQSHSSGFEAWMRSRGNAGVKVYTSEDVIDQFGVVKDSYDAVPLPKIRAHTVRCKRSGVPSEVLAVEAEALPQGLEWGEVLLSIRYAPVNPADLYTVQTGGTYGESRLEPPFVAGHDGVAVVVKVGPGVKGLAENDWVVPLGPGLGTWRSLAVAKEKDLLKIPTDLMPPEQCAMLREMLAAYRLLEDHGNLKPGDAVILNAANSTVGQLVLQLCSLLRLRAIAVISGHKDFERTSEWLKGLGAAEVLQDSGSLKFELESLKFFAKPKLALDAVGGASATRLADALGEGGQLVVYGAMGGRAPHFTWQQWVFQGVQVKGFNVRRWVRDNKKKLPALLESMAKLVNAGKLRAEFTEYELHSELGEALEHASDRGRNTKILLKVTDVGEQYE
ncbi:trans-2-enoyl-reductase [Micractinium conductrix]|uniref:enoyl-[acyl-carrier-protein] reductase n=1 Tax=Micractinium conductrix TaxID=554055 RepID=A0A2P6V814_9CHLO|nr:trans-2-enoyl-reductase [Micractinium conductrix]|eukprot:PSC70227.1 trans-2-enoyl-reductase [Micractinium conductrix]